MLDPKKIAEIDQSMASLKEIVIPALKAYYDKLVEVGFSVDQAFQLTCQFQLFMMSSRGSM